MQKPLVDRDPGDEDRDCCWIGAPCEIHNPEGAAELRESYDPAAIEFPTPTRPCPPREFGQR